MKPAMVHVINTGERPTLDEAGLQYEQGDVYELTLRAFVDKQVWKSSYVKVARDFMREIAFDVDSAALSGWAQRIGMNPDAYENAEELRSAMVAHIEGQLDSRLRKRTYSPAEAADLTGYNAEYIRQLIREGDLAAFQARERGNYRISRAELARWWRDKGGGELFEGAA
jgi:excisionase family DNA binding protein